MSKRERKLLKAIAKVRAEGPIPPPSPAVIDRLARVWIESHGEVI